MNKKQLELLTKYCSGVVQNNQEVHPSDVPYVIAMIIKLAEKNYVLEESQMKQIAKSLHSLARPDLPTSTDLTQFLMRLANIGYYYSQLNHSPEHFKRPMRLIVNDIIEEKDIPFSESK